VRARQETYTVISQLLVACTVTKCRLHNHPAPTVVMSKL